MRKITKRRLALCGAAICLAISVLISYWPRTLDGMEVRILDVGQGDATLIRTGDQCMLIDAGPNSAEEDLCSMLYALGVFYLDVVIFTHPDEDHIGGGDLVLAKFDIGTIYFSPCSHESANFTRLLDAAAASGADVRIGEVGVRFALGDAAVTLLAPAAYSGDNNNASIVTRVDYGTTSVLLMGDAEAEAEAVLLAGSADLRADLLKLGHHGADSSTSEALLDAVCPQFAAISCGSTNSYGHPARRVVDALTARGIAIGRTDREGTLVYRSDGEKLWRE